MYQIPDFSLIDKRVLNPEPLLAARREPGGKTAVYDCPWCGESHRHRIKTERVIHSKESHCPVFYRLFPFYYSTWFYLEGEADPHEAHRLHRRRWSDATR